MPEDRFVPELFGFETDRGGFVDGDGLWFDAGRFGVMPRVVRDTDPDQFMALSIAAAALDDSGALGDVDVERVGVILGRGGYLTPGGAQFVQRVRTAGQLHAILRTLLPDVAADRLDAVRDAFVDQLGPLPNDAAVGVLPNMAASRIANRLDLGGPAYMVDAACASSLVAVDAGIGELQAGRCDLVLAGGVHHCRRPRAVGRVLQAGGAQPHRARSGPFSRHADGILIGEGTGMVALERLSSTPSATATGSTPCCAARACRATAATPRWSAPTSTARCWRSSGPTARRASTPPRSSWSRATARPRRPATGPSSRRSAGSSARPTATCPRACSGR